MRRLPGWFWVFGLAIAQPIALGSAQEAPAPEAASSNAAKAKKSKVVGVDEAAQQPKPAKLEQPAAAAAAPAKPGADKPAKASAANEPATARKAKPKHPSKAEAEVASAQPPPSAPPPPPPPAAGPKAPAPPPVAAAKPAGPSCSIEEPEQPRGGRLDVLGSGFGQVPVVRIAQKPVRMIERRSDRISVQVPADSDGGTVTLQSEGQSTRCGDLVIIGKNR